MALVTLADRRCHAYDIVAGPHIPPHGDRVGIPLEHGHDPPLLLTDQDPVVLCFFLIIIVSEGYGILWKRLVPERSCPSFFFCFQISDHNLFSSFPRPSSGHSCRILNFLANSMGS